MQSTIFTGLLSERAMITTPLFSPRRALGRTGFVATILGIGDLADRQLSLRQLVATVRRALDAGLNLIDTAPGYESGYSEQIVGQALQGYRDSVFVIDKIDSLDKPVAPQIEASLTRLHMDYTDLFVFHNLSTLEAWSHITAPGGGMEQLDQAICAGKTRFKGISSHSPDVLAAAIPSGLVDVVMFPVGPYVDQRYIEEILPLARQYHIGTVCFKTFGAGKLLGDTSGYNQPLQEWPGSMHRAAGQEPLLPHLSVEQCVHYTLTCDPDVALLGLSDPREQDVAFAAAQACTAPLGPEQMLTMRQLAVAAVAHKGPCRWNPSEPWALAAVGEQISR
jgi:aryl-alcohol dehydrogenase-like predicted oxidoreductase